MFLKKKKKSGIEFEESQTSLSEGWKGYKYILILVDFILISLCIYGSVISLWATFHVTFKVRTSALFLLFAVFVCLILFREMKPKWWVVLGIMTACLLAGIFFRYELLHGAQYWIARFLVYYNDYFKQRFSVPITITGEEQRCSTILLLFMIAFFAIWMTQYNITSNKKYRGMNFPIFILFLLFIVPFVTGEVAKKQYIISFVLGSIPLLVRNKNKSHKVLVQMRLYAFTCIAVMLIVVTFLIPEELYNQHVDNLKSVKENVQDVTKSNQFTEISYWLTDLEILPFTVISSGGVSNGTVGQFDKIEYDYKTDAWVYWPREESGTELYFKSYVGTGFNNRQWTGLTDSEQKKYKAIEEKNDISYENLFTEWYSRFQSLASNYMFSSVKLNVFYKVSKTQLGRKHSLLTYDTKNDVYLDDKYLTTSKSKNKKSYWEEAVIPDMEDNMYSDLETGWSNIEYMNFYWSMTSLAIDDSEITTGVYKGKTAAEAVEDYTSRELDYRNFVYDTYTEVDSDIAPEMRKQIESEDVIEPYILDYDFQSADYTGDDYVDAINSVLNSLDTLVEDTGYTLSPGKTPANKDFVDYFLYENKKGYCVHYATAATIFFRMCGIPARYVEGYYMGNTDVTMSSLVTLSEEPDKQYYKLNMTDANAHAWTEIYINGFGWLQVDCTKLASGAPVSEADTKSDSQENAIKGTRTDLNPQENMETSKEPDGLNQVTSPKPSENTKSDDSVTIPSPKKANDVGQTAVLSRWQRLLLFAFVLLVIFAATVWIHYICIMKQQKNRKNSNSSNRRVKFYYHQLSKMLYVLCKIKGKAPLKEKAAELSEKLDFVSKEDLEHVARVVDKASFGLGQVSDYDCTKIQMIYEQVKRNFYEKMSLPKKIYYKVWHVI